MAKYKKAKAWMGKDLDLFMGTHSKKIFDNDTLEGPEYAKFVGMGFLVEIKSPKVIEPVVTPKAEVASAPVVASVTEDAPVAPPAETSGVTKTKLMPSLPKKQRPKQEVETLSETPAPEASAETSSIVESTNPDGEAQKAE